MSAFDELVTSLVTGGMQPSAAAALVARAVIEATAKTKTAGAARTARWRVRHKASQNVTGASVLSPVTVTSQPSQSVTSDADDGRNAPLSILPSLTFSGVLFEEKKEKKKEVSARARGARLPDDWRPDEAGWDFAAARGHAASVIEDEILKFRNYWTNRTDKQACKPRWDRAWQNWIMNVKGNSNGQSSVLAASSRLVERVRQFNEPAPADQPRIRSGTSGLLISAVPNRTGQRS